MHIHRGTKGEDVARVQRIAGVRDDGDFGPKTYQAVRERLAAYGIVFSGTVTDGVFAAVLRVIGERPMPWGQRFTEPERQMVREVCFGLEMDPAHLMNVIAFESAESFSPSKRNMAGSGAVGLIQFMPDTAAGLLGMDHREKLSRELAATRFSRMGVAEQLAQVYRYFLPYAGNLHRLEDVYMAVLYPAAVGREPTYVLFRDGTKAFRQNSGLDIDGDRVITKYEAATRVREKVAAGNLLLA